MAHGKATPKRQLQEKPAFALTNSMNPEDLHYSMVKQILIWTPIVLTIALYFVVMSLVNMPIQKNSILYAKYGTSKTSSQ